MHSLTTLKNLCYRSEGKNFEIWTPIIEPEIE